MLLKRNQQSSDVPGRGRGVTVRRNFNSKVSFVIVVVEILYCWEKLDTPLHTHTHAHTLSHILHTCVCTWVYMLLYTSMVLHSNLPGMFVYGCLHSSPHMRVHAGADTWLYRSSVLTIHSLFHLEQKLCWRTQKARFKSIAGVRSPGLDTWNNQCKLV